MELDSLPPYALLNPYTSKVGWIITLFPYYSVAGIFFFPFICNILKLSCHILYLILKFPNSKWICQNLYPLRLLFGLWSSFVCEKFFCFVKSLPFWVFYNAIPNIYIFCFKNSMLQLFTSFRVNLKKALISLLFPYCFFSPETHVIGIILLCSFQTGISPLAICIYILSMYFCGLIASSFSLNNNPLYRWATVLLSINLLMCIMVTFSFGNCK